ncbi:hypothetical protein BY998_1452 [Methylobacterium sp. B4]|nr:hypothetical protein BY998_1452 [Methylobacterium sp. B4]
MKAKESIQVQPAGVVSTCTTSVPASTVKTRVARAASGALAPTNGTVAFFTVNAAPSTLPTSALATATVKSAGSFRKKAWRSHAS